MKLFKALIISLLTAFCVQAQVKSKDSLWASDKIAEVENLIENRKYRSAKSLILQLTKTPDDKNYKIPTLSYVIYKCLSQQKRISQKKKLYLDSASRFVARNSIYANESFAALVYQTMKFNSHLTDYQDDQNLLAQLNWKIIARYQHNANYYFIDHYLNALVKLRKYNTISDDSLLQAYATTANILGKKIKRKSTGELPDSNFITLHKNFEKIQLLAIGNCENTQKIYEPIIKIDSTNFDLIYRAKVMLDMMQCSEAGWLKPYVELNSAEIDKIIRPMAEKRASIYFLIAQDMAKKGYFSGAKKQALEVIKMDTSFTSKVYTFIGDMYMNSANTCKGENPQNLVQAKAIFILAYKMYEKAGNEQGMTRAKQYFPTKEEINQYQMNGKKVKITCWIQETVIIPKL